MKHVAVLYGGLSAEREVSLSTGKPVIETLGAMGYQVTPIDMQRDVAKVLADIKPDVVFNALHGTYGEDGCVQGLLEVMQIPYTHSGVRASAMAMHKPTAKELFIAAGIRCAKDVVTDYNNVIQKDVLPRPYVLKPVDEGSSVGIRIVKEGDVLSLDDLDVQGASEVMVEQYISGRELSVAVLDGKALGAVEIRPKEGWYDYRSKYTAGMTEYLLPAPVEKAIYSEAMELAERAHNALGCRGVSRADIRYSDQDGLLYMLEVNTHPGMTPTSLVPKIAAHAGMEFRELVDALLASACCDHG